MRNGAKLRKLSEIGEVEETDLKELLQVVIKRKSWIAGIVIFATIASVILNYYILTPVYETRTLLMVKNVAEQQHYIDRSDRWEDLTRKFSSLPQMTMNTYLGQLKSDVLLRTLYQTLELDQEKYSIKHLNRNISAEAVADSNLIQIVVRDNDPAVATLIANTLSLEFQRFISDYNKERMKQSVQIFKEQINDVEKELALVKKNLDELNNVIIQINEAIERGSEAEKLLAKKVQKERQAEYNILTRELELLERHYLVFTESLALARFYESIDIGEANVIIVAEAVEPQAPVKPKKLINVAATIGVALIIGIGAAFTVEILDNRLRTAEQVKRFFGLTVIGKIPKLNEGERIIESQDSKSRIVEAFRSLRTNLHFISLNSNLKTLLITSTEPAEGKSTIATNLAITLARTGKKILLIDLDLRKPTLHRVFSLDNDIGTINLLGDKIPIFEAIQKTQFENLHVITSGPIVASSFEVLISADICQLFKRLNNYDLILIDSPPVMSVADTVTVADKVDGVLIVMNSGKVKIDMAKLALEQLGKAEAKVLGVVLNKVQLTRDEQRYYNYYGE